METERKKRTRDTRREREQIGHRGRNQTWTKRPLWARLNISHFGHPLPKFVSPVVLPLPCFLSPKPTIDQEGTIPLPFSVTSPLLFAITMVSNTNTFGNQKKDYKKTAPLSGGLDEPPPPPPFFFYFNFF